MPDNYLTAAGVAESVYVIEKSRFIACIAPVKDAAAAAEFLAGLRKRYYDASHICYAYSLEPGGAQKFSDGGEPQGTAGQPIAEVVKAKRLRHTLIAVVRYFGGKKLGAGGLVRAYTEAAVRAAAAAGVSEYVYCDFISVEYGFALSRRLLAYPVTGKTYGGSVLVTYAVPVAERAQFEERLAAALGAAANYTVTETGYYRKTN